MIYVYVAVVLVLCASLFAAVAAYEDANDERAGFFGIIAIALIAAIVVLWT